MDKIQSYKYSAFISYQRKDEEWAKWLHTQLEHYHLPVNIVEARPELPADLRPLFIDELELSGGNLTEKIHDALLQSNYLIVLCSPNSSESPWVNLEVQTFTDLGRVERIIPVILDGEPYAVNPERECFPPALRTLRGTTLERLGINTNAGREVTSVKVVATMLNLSFDELWNRYAREKEEEHQRFLEEKRRLQRLESRYLSAKANELLSEGEAYKAILLSMSALPSEADPVRPFVKEAETALRKALACDEFIVCDLKKNVRSIAVSRDGRFAVAVSDDRCARLIDLKNGVERSMLEKLSRPYAIDFSPVGNQVVIATHKGQLIQWDLHTNRTIRKGYQDVAKGVGYSADGKWVVSFYADHTISIRDAATLVESKRIKWKSAPRRVVMHPDNCLLAVASADPVIRIFDIDSEQIVGRLEAHTDLINSLCYSTDGKRLLSADSQGVILLWDVATCRVLSRYEGHTTCVNSVIFGVGEREIISASTDRTIRVWDVASGEELRKIEGHSQKINEVRCCLQGRFLISAAMDGQVRLWREPCALPNDRFVNEIRSASIHADKSLMTLVQANGTVRIVDVDTLEDVRVHHADSEPIVEAVLSYDSRSLITIAANHEIRVGAQTGGGTSVYIAPRPNCHSTSNIAALLHQWGEEAYEKPRKLEKRGQLQASPDGVHFAALSDSHKEIKIYKINNGLQTRSLYASGNKPFMGMCYSADGNLMVTSQANCAQVWEVASGICVYTYTGMQSPLRQTLITDDNRYLLLIFALGMALYDLHNEQMICDISKPKNSINGACLDEENGRILIYNTNNSIELYDLFTLRLIKTISLNSNIVFASFCKAGKAVIYVEKSGKIGMKEVEYDLPYSELLKKAQARMQDRQLTEKDKYALGID